MECSVHPLLPRDLDYLDDRISEFLIESSPFLHHRYFNREEMLKIAREDVERKLLAGDGMAFSLMCGDRVLGLCCCSAVSWDSRYFEFPMGRLDFWGLSSATTESLVMLIRTALEASRSRSGFRHVSCRVGAGEYGVINALASAGFRMFDAQRIYVARGSAGRGRSLYAPRPCLNKDRQSLLELFRKTPFESRYTRDAMLPGKKTEEMYVQWISSLLDLPDGEKEIYVLERDGEVVAAGAGRYVDFLNAGVKKSIMTDGIFASRKGYAGAYIGITKAVVGAAMARGCQLAELKVSATNYPANRVLQSLGYEGVLLSYAFHLTF